MISVARVAFFCSIYHTLADDHGAVRTRAIERRNSNVTMTSCVILFHRGPPWANASIIVASVLLRCWLPLLTVCGGRDRQRMKRWDGGAAPNTTTTTKAAQKAAAGDAYRKHNGGDKDTQ